MFTIDDDLLTPTFKLKRPQLQKKWVARMPLVLASVQLPSTRMCASPCAHGLPTPCGRPPSRAGSRSRLTTCTPTCSRSKGALVWKAPMHAEAGALQEERGLGAQGLGAAVDQLGSHTRGLDGRACTRRGGQGAAAQGFKDEMDAS